ncbi:hypothetical protein BC834DRAFT_973049 [Gloeopeniophorella convolvens]|nr:hypothetical protein BC834DRAFT_973049 [Gloeopeniophorella convolvens]
MSTISPGHSTNALRLQILRPVIFCTISSLSLFGHRHTAFLSGPVPISRYSKLAMDMMQSYDAILFPADGRPPHVVSLMTSPASLASPHAPGQTSAARVPHPEVHMEYIAEDPNRRAWHYQAVEALDGMNKKFASPYMIYFPVLSRDGMPFPVNRTVRDIQEELNKGRGPGALGRGAEGEQTLWRGNLVAAKFADDRFTQMTDASMADFPIVKNYLGTHPSPLRVSAPPLHGSRGAPPSISFAEPVASSSTQAYEFARAPLQPVGVSVSPMAVPVAVPVPVSVPPALEPPEVHGAEQQAQAHEPMDL